jgi:hypothetical protein
MTAKEKANELVDSFCKIVTAPFGQDARISHIDKAVAINCATKCVDEIIDAIDWHEFEIPNKELDFWLDVLKELNQM